MKKNHKASIATAFVMASFVFSFIGVTTAQAATTPSLGTASTFGILSNLFQHNIAATTINGDLGYSSEAGAGAVVVNGGTTYVNDATWTAAGNAQNAAWADLNAQYLSSCTSLGGGAVNLDAIDIDGAGPLPPGTFTAGCYSSGGAMNITVNQTVTLSGAGTFLFRPGGALTTQANTTVSLSGASACNVFWIPVAATTLGANSAFTGTIIDAAGITMGNLATLSGRALAYGGTLTADTNTVTVPTCTTSTSSPSYPNASTLTVIKQVINDNGGTAIYTDFPLFVNGGPVFSGWNMRMPSGTYMISETSRANYKTTFVGDCDATGKVIHGTNNDICTIVNNDIGPAVAPIPPLIHITKIPSPLVLPAGPGLVTYNYAVSNVGIVPMTNVTVTDNKCPVVTYFSGDTNLDLKLDVSETWNYKCAMLLTQTTTNTGTATGRANGLTATDSTDAAVVVGSSVVPPLIDLIKIPTPLFLPIGGGAVTYTYFVSNPGTEPLSNVNITDDKCTGLPGRVSGHPGDLNSNNLLENNETWTFTCLTNLKSTTTNTGTATGSANGLTVSHSFKATVVVATPGFPNTGLPIGKNLAIILSSGILAGALLLYAARKKQVA